MTAPQQDPTMAHAAHMTIDELNTVRTKTAQKSGYHRRTLVLAQTCPTTRGGVVVFQNTHDRKMTAYLFRPTQTVRYYNSVPVESAHAALAMLEKVRTDMAAQKAAKVAPHTLAVGDIMIEMMGCTMARASFFQVTAIPHPRKVALAPLPERYDSGDWMSGSVVPDIAPNAAPIAHSSSDTIVTISMEHGTPQYRKNSVTKLSKWNGKPAYVYSD